MKDALLRGQMSGQHILGAAEVEVFDVPDVFEIPLLARSGRPDRG